MLSSGANVIIWDEILSSGTICYHLELMLSSGTKLLSFGMKYDHLGCNVIICPNVYHLGLNVIIWDEMLSSGMKCYHLGCNVIIWD
jgi:hypothetical protein